LTWKARNLEQGDDSGDGSVGKPTGDTLKATGGASPELRLG
jgi:hypothetical protein